MQEAALDRTRERERSELRFRWLGEQIERLRREKPHWSDEAIDEVYDKVKDKLLEDPNFGRSPEAIWGAIRMQKGWVASDHKRVRENPDGSPRNHPRAARSLDDAIGRPDGGGASLGGITPGPEATQPERVVELRQEVARIREAARERGIETERIVVAVMLGAAPAKIAEQCGVEVSTVYKRIERFRTLYRAAEEGGDELAR